METEIKNTETKDTPIENNNSTPETNETPEQINWKKYRETREQHRKEKEEAEKKAVQKEAEAAALKAAMESLLNKPVTIGTKGTEEVEDLSEDERIQRKVDQALLERSKREEQTHRERELREFPQRLQQAYSDFSQICSSENLDYLDYHYPDISKAFQSMPDGFDKWSSIYKSVKKLIPNPDSKKDISRAEKNMKKPQAMSIAGITQTGDTTPVTLDDKRREENWRRMQKVMRQTK